MSYYEFWQDKIEEIESYLDSGDIQSAEELAGSLADNLNDDDWSRVESIFSEHGIDLDLGLF